jgi:hypothetical protein
MTVWTAPGHKVCAHPEAGAGLQWPSSPDVESVLEERYSVEHMFVSVQIAEPNEQGADPWI